MNPTVIITLLICHRKNFYPVIRLIYSQPLPKKVNFVYPSGINYAIKEHDDDALGGGGIDKYNLFQKGDHWFMSGDG
ncbi:hypothetical protein [Pediococcus argentinicus]|uniref:Uncharacterized protein n=1 Tax=Pediococcus argentinicus TaxID=480391 RepID=A0A0R2N465_9LACO|nr:hypothetical protein [Pediococcus argentinicus]KRO20566.1 hypothetical protein IV88_GL001579 [Pediococcus argentinicus]GEP20384.1 hypothetical protein LSA03_17680 [Pediococcus argentinicus]